METFADYILKEKNLGSKMEIVYYLSKKEGIFFEKQVIFKTEILRMFTNIVDLGLDTNLLLTASLLANCKKIEVSKEPNKIKSYASKGAEYLSSIGFDDNFCTICQGLNRYQEQSDRKNESDVLELVDQFGAMLLDRPERIGMESDEALVLLQYRNLKNVNNKYLQTFVEFINKIDKITIKEEIEITPLKLLVKMYRETENLKRFITGVVYEYQAKIDDAIYKSQYDEFSKISKNIRKLEKGNPNRPLFTEQTTKKLIGKLIEKKNIK